METLVGVGGLKCPQIDKQINVIYCRKDWWTSGRRVSDVESLQFYWEGDGQQIESYFYWHNDSIPTDFTKDYIMYNYNGKRVT